MPTLVGRGMAHAIVTSLIWENGPGFLCVVVVVVVVEWFPQHVLLQERMYFQIINAMSDAGMMT